MRRYTRAHRAQQAATAKKSESYWYGQGGRTLQQINSLVNSRPVREIGYQSPADVLAAYLADPRFSRLRSRSSEVGRRLAIVLLYPL